MLATLAIGATFAGRYRVGRTLGQGALATVVEATTLDTNAPVVLKIVLGAARASADARARFEREVNILRSLSHSSVVRIVDAGAEDAVPFYAMERLVGRTWADRIREGGPMQPAEALRLLARVADALDEAHAHGIVHRDLKPENLFLVEGDDALVKVLDFGLSRVADDKKLTQAGTLIGTPRYMAPEQIASEQTVDRRADVFSLAVVAYESLSGGISPYDANDAAQLLGAILHGRRLPLSSRASNIPNEVDIVLSRAMSVERRERQATAGELIASLHTAFRITPPANAPFAVIALAPSEIAPRGDGDGARELLPFQFREAASVERPSLMEARAANVGVTRPPSRAARSWRWLVPALGLAAGLALGFALWRAFAGR